MNPSVYDCIIHFLSRRASAEDLQQLKEWLDADPANRDELKQWLKTWDAAEMADNAAKYCPDEAFLRLMFRLQTSAEAPPAKPRGRAVLRNIRRIAAALAIGLLAGWSAFSYLSRPQAPETAFMESIVPLGSKSMLLLPDGSTVWLNAGSRLRYPVDYGKNARDIYLEGEGYFKVARKPDKPFTVHTAMMNVTALGTEFNVRAYRDDGETEAMLVSGAIRIDNGETDAVVREPVELKPGQRFAVTTAGVRPAAGDSASATPPAAARAPKVSVRQLTAVAMDANVSWKDPNWRIEREELQSLAVKLERRYDVKITVDERLKNYRFSGTLKDESLEQVLTAMQFSSPILFTVRGKEVTLHVDGSKLNRK
jgi:ferric-dicitrate binding protein FerR (iron transport regulator)